MKGDSCVLFPVKGEQPSKLYQKLYNLTGKDRKLTNLLYALSLQDEVKAMFAHSDLNSQGEPNIDVFIDKMNIKDIMNEKATIKDAKESIGAIDSSGNIVYVDDMMTITQRVIDFNNTHNNLRAVIKYSKDGFSIDVDIINAENFYTNSSLQMRMDIMQALLDHFENKGLNTILSEESKKFFNPLNIYYAINSLRELGKGTDRITLGMSTLLVDLFNKDPLMERLITQLGDDLPIAISQVSGLKVASPITLTATQESQIQNVLTKIQRQAKLLLHPTVVDPIISTAKSKYTTQKTIADTNELSVVDTLKELYSLYHLDQESVDTLTKKVRTVSDAATKLLQIQVALQSEQKLKTGKPISEKQLLTRQRDIDNGAYIVSTVKMLEGLIKNIKTQEVKLKKLDSKLKADPESLETIRSLSSILLEQLDLVEAYSDVLSQLSNNDLLDNDDNTGNDALLDDIRDLAKDLSETLTRIEKNARRKQYDTVAAFLKIYWGEDKTLPDGSTMTLQFIMDTASADINFFDRFLYAANTTNDEMMNLVAEAVKRASEKRNNKLREQLKEVRSITKELYDSGSSTSFIFERDSDGYPSKIISDYDYARYEKELEEYKDSIRKDSSIDKSEYDALEKDWIQKHSRTVKYHYTDSKGATKSLSLTVPIYDAPVKVKDRLTSAQYKYYKKMMDMKAEMLAQIDAVSNNTLFDVIELSNNVTQALAESGGNPVEIYKAIKNKVVDAFSTREDDTDYGSILDANNLALRHVNFRGEPIYTLPLFYRHKIKDRSRVSTDFSRSMMAYLATSQQYVEMNKILDALMLTKDYMLTQRRAPQKSGSGIVADIQKVGKKAYVVGASKLGINTELGGLADDFYERMVFGQNRKDEGYVFGTKIKLDKLVDVITGYTSVAGLAVNVLGSEANLLVGKLQMLIESGLGMGGEFFNMKDMTYAEAKYFRELPELLLEVNSTTKSSLLGLLMEKFDVLDDFYDKIKETGFYKSPLSKIIGNTNLFFLYGIGEHLLHAEGMLAVLHNKNNYVLDPSGKEVPIIEAFDVVKDATGNGALIVKSGYTKKDGSSITEQDIQKLKGRISYVNKSMHGAFGNADKGMIHRYAVGRLIMNFRQWMPAHYQRRFRGLHYDTDLGEYREGYYVSAFKFIRGCAQDLKRAKFQIGTRWHELDDMQKYNLKRAMAETLILGMLTASIALLGDYKDKKGNWAYRHLIYLLKRLSMETKASDPVAAYGFVSNIITILNSPAAALNTAEKVSNLLDITDLFVTIENGKYQGNNLYFHNLEKSLPWYGQIIKMLELGNSDDLFKIFD